MPLLETTGQNQSLEKNDFSGGFSITEIIKGQPRVNERIILIGEFAPHESVPFGGKQKIIKEYYAGSNDPSIQVLGAQEDDISIKGLLKERSLPSDLAGAAQDFQEKLDAMRIRGNLVELAFGEYKRYGFIESGTFKVMRRNRIAYDLNFLISGKTIPKNYYLVNGSDGDLTKPNRDLASRAAAYLLQLEEAKPAGMKKSMIDEINDTISGIAGEISKVTKFVDGILDDVDKLAASAERAIGVIRNTRNFIVRSSRRISAIPNTIQSLSNSGLSEGQKLLTVFQNNDYIHKIKNTNKVTASELATMQIKIEATKLKSFKTIHLVRQGETLQKISIKYLGTPDKWIDIKELNNLRDTNLVRGSLLKIPN